MGVNIPEYIFNGVRVEVWIAAGALFISFLIGKVRERKKNLPPGPVGLPFVGYYPFVTKFPHLKFTKLAEKYGNVFSLYLGCRLVVVLNDADSIREALPKRELLARPPNHPLTVFNGIHLPQSSSDIRDWQEHRRITLQILKDLGQRQKLENLIQDEIQHFLNALRQSKGKPIDLAKPLYPSISNNICSLFFGERFEDGNSARIVIDDGLRNIRSISSTTSFCKYFPWITKFFTMFKLMNFMKRVKSVERMLNLTEEKIIQHKQTLDPKNIRDYIDAYLVEMEKKKEKGLETTLSDTALKGSVMFYSFVGTESVKSAIALLLYTMAAFPEVQEKVQKEIKEVLGQNDHPEFPDQNSMPYTKAVMYEIMRWKTLIPLNQLRLALDDISVAGYCIPRNSYVIANFWSVNHSPKYWENPEKFQPERFLNPDGTLLKSDYFTPFSIGKRACPAEQMATMEMFLYFVAVLQRFQVSFPKGFKPNFEIDVAVGLMLKSFSICFTPH